jgi:hypothetical protein
VPTTTTPKPPCNGTIGFWNFTADPNGTTIDGIVAGKYLDGTDAIVGVSDNSGCGGQNPNPGRLSIPDQKVYMSCGSVLSKNLTNYIINDPRLSWVPANSSVTDPRFFFFQAKWAYGVGRINFNKTLANGTIINYWQVGKVDLGQMWYGNENGGESRVTSGYEVLICTP